MGDRSVADRASSTATRTGRSPASRRTRAAIAALARLAGLALGVALGGACLDRPIASYEPETTNAFSQPVSLRPVDKIDILFMIDDSGSMADKQTVLAAAVPTLLDRLINPRCVDPNPDNASNEALIPSSGGKCADPTKVPEFVGISDIHVAVVGSSLGSHGSDSCTASQTGRPNGNAYALTAGVKGPVTASDGGFLDWHPGAGAGDKNAYTDASTLESAFNDLVTGVGQVGCGYECQMESWYRFLIDPNPPAAVGDELGMVIGQESSHVATVTKRDGKVLQQRKDFLRPDSLVAVVLLSDENDSCTVDGQFPRGARRAADAPDNAGQVVEWGAETDPRLKNYHVDPCATGHGKASIPGVCDRFGFSSYALDQTSATELTPGTKESKTVGYHPPRGSQACEADPWSDDCGPTPGTTPQFADNVDLVNDDPNRDVDGWNLRFFEPKRRFGVTTQYPLQRYIDGLSLSTVFDSSGASLQTPPSDGYRDEGIPVALEVPNPLFDDLQYDPKTSTRPKMPRRDPGLVFFAAIVGVPWQDIANDPRDLSKGLRTAQQLHDDEKAGKKGWSYIVGDQYAPTLAARRAGDPLMVESVTGRTQLSPSLASLTLITGEALGGPGSWNSINGHEWDIANKVDQANDLQYACIFPLHAPRTATEPTDPVDNRCISDGATHVCDCAPSQPNGVSDDDYKNATATRNNPLCEKTPGANVYYEVSAQKKPDGKDIAEVKTSTQPRAKAYPGLRYLEVLRDLDPKQSIVASICPAVTDPAKSEAPDYGYTPAVNAIVARLKTQLLGPCTPRTLDVNEHTGAASCVILAASCPLLPDAQGVPRPSCTAAEIARLGMCNVNADGSANDSLGPVPAEVTAALSPEVLAYDVRCAVKQLTGDALQACQTQPRIDPSIHGWCYVDPALAKPADVAAEATIVQKCPADQRHEVRFAQSTDLSDSKYFVTCLGAAAGTRAASVGAAGSPSAGQ